jgi:integrase/recombinase XerD
MATVAIVLNTTKKLSNGDFTVSLRVSQNKTKKYYSINTLLNDQSMRFYCSSENWIPAKAEDNGLGKFKRTFKAFKEYNVILEKKLSEAQQILKSYDEADIVFSFERFEIDLKRGKLPTKIQDYYQIKMNELEEQKKIGLWTIYSDTQRLLKKYRPEALLTDIDVKFLEGFESFLRFQRNNKDTTISVKMRNIQRVLNLAIEDKLLKQECYPFGEKKYSVNKRLNSKTRKRSVPLDIVRKIKDLQLIEGSSHHLAQQIFMFSFYTRGMNFIDVVGLKWKDIEANEINYYRKKTGQLFQIPVNNHTQAILDYYAKLKISADGYIFPIYNNEVHVTEKQRYTRKKSALKKVNDRLKDIAKLIGEEGLKLTTYVSRHSYATNLKRSGVATSYISEALGHQTEEQTQTYLADFEKGVISSLESKIFDF